MKITREETSPLEVVLKVELESADLDPYLDRSYKRVVNRVQIPGFRRGKAPRIIVENHLGREALVREGLDFILQESVDRAILEENLAIFGEPEVEMGEVDPLSFKATVPLEPIVELGDFRSLRLEPETAEVSQEEVDLVIDRIRLDSSPWQPAERPAKLGDLLTLDVDGAISGEKVADDKGVDFIPAQDNPFPFPGFSLYLEGMSKGEPKEFTLQVPEDYQDATIAGKECRFAVKVLEIKEKILPELDDEFAKGAGEGYESLEALRASVLEDLTERAKRTAERAFQERSLEAVISGASVEVSDLTTNREIDHMMEEQARARQGHREDVDAYLQRVGKTEDELRGDLRPPAQERLTRVLIMRKLAQEENIEVSPEEVELELDSLAPGSSESAASLRQALSSDSGRSSIGNAILTRKVLECLAQIARGEQVDGVDKEALAGEGPSSDTDPENPPGEGDEADSARYAGAAPAGRAHEEGVDPSDS